METNDNHIGWYDPVTKKFATSPNSFPMAAQIIKVYCEPPVVSHEPKQWRDLTTAQIKAMWNLTKKPSEFAAMVIAKFKEENSERP